MVSWDKSSMYFGHFFSIAWCLKMSLEIGMNVGHLPFFLSKGSSFSRCS